MARLPLEDIKIIDLGWVIACPHGTRLLADLGAQVIKLESKAKLDGVRGDFPRQGVTNPLEEGGGVFQEHNRNKMGLALNLKNPKGWEIFGRLIGVADAVAANFSATGFKKLGLGWEELSKFNPGIIVVNAPGMGNWGPHSHFMTFGPNLQALAGITSLIGYPGQEPVGSGGPWVDFMGGGALAIAILAAIEYRRKTGKGQFIDISQHEVALSFLGSALLNWEANKRVTERCGNHHRANAAAPHSCYRCQGEDRWCVISVASDEEWDNFCKVLGNPDWTQEERFASHLQRILNQDELDKLVEAWTADRTAEEVVDKMQAGGVSAGVVQNVEDLLQRDVHIKERQFLHDVKFDPHPDKKPDHFTIPGVITRLSGQTLSVRRPAPRQFGQDNEYVLKEILGMTDKEVEQATAEGAFS